MVKKSLHSNCCHIEIVVHIRNFTGYIFSSLITNLKLEIVADICWFQLFFGQQANEKIF